MNSYKIIAADHFCDQRDKKYPYAIKVFIVSRTYRKAINRLRKKYPNYANQIKIYSHDRDLNKKIKLSIDQL
jgi:hypothetical protein